MAGTSPCCFQGHIHQGTATGSFKQIGGVDCYVAEPKGKPNGKAIVIAPDVFGAQFINTQLLADHAAESGFLVLIVDYFDGKPAPPWILECFLQLTKPELVSAPATSLLQSWVVGPLRKLGALGWILTAFPPFLIKHGMPPPAKTHKVHYVERVVAALRAGEAGGAKVAKVGVVGYCYGGGFALALAAPGGDARPIIDAFAVAHTDVKVPGYLEGLRAPGLFIAAENDHSFPDSARAKAEALLREMEAAGKGGPYKVKHYPGTFHGFATRGDPRNEVVRAAKEDALNEVVQWFTKHM